MRQQLIPAMVAVLLGAACPGGSATPGARDDAPAAAGAPVALVDVTLIDGTGAPPRPHVTIVLDGRRVADVFATGSRPLPAGAATPDVRGHWVIPGLIDAHAHLATFERGDIMPALLRHSLMGGVTTVRDMGGNARVVAALARAAAHDTVLSPRIYPSAVVAGPAWFAAYDPARLRYWSGDAPVGAAPGVRRLADDAGIAAVVEDARAVGAAGIKVYSDVPPARLAALVRQAAARGMPVWSHGVVPPSRPDDAVAAGVRTLSHADQLIWSTAAPGDSIGSRRVRAGLLARARADDPALARLHAAMRARGTMLEPTLYIISIFAANAREDGGGAGADSMLDFTIAATRAAHAAGVAIVAGTDALGRESPNIHGELQLLVSRAGLTPLEAITAATRNGARAIGADDSLGTVAPGKLADLVVLRADPAADIRNTQTVAWVVRAGRLLRRTERWVQQPLAEPARP